MTTTTKANPFREGDILVSQWGYDQTNVDFRQVTRVTTATVRSVAIGSETVETLTSMSSRVVPCTKRSGREEATSRILKEPGLLKAPNGCSYMRKWDGKPVVATSWA